MYSEMMNGCYNHPCVTFWVLFNYNNQYFQEISSTTLVKMDHRLQNAQLTSRGLVK